MVTFQHSCRHLRTLAVGLALGGAVLAQANLIAHVSRDYLGNVPATDRFWFYKNLDGSPRTSGGGLYPALEYKSNRGVNFPVVSVRANTIVVVVKFMNPQPFSWVVGNFVVNGVRLRIPSAGTTDPEVVLPLSASVSGTLLLAPDGGEGTVTLTLSGVPYVARGNLEIDAKVVGAAQYWTTGGYKVWERIYIPDAQPVGLQTVPWTDLMEYACAWAKFETGAASVARASTFGLYWKGRWVYDADRPFFWAKTSLTSGWYNLKEAIGGAGVRMDCQDTSGFLHLALAALGHSSTTRTLWNAEEGWPPQEPIIGFLTNPVCPMGSDASVDEHPVTGNPTYISYPFNFHQVVVAPSGTYDAAAAHLKDPGNGWYRNPPAGWVLAYHWQTAVTFGFLGLVFGPAYMLPGVVDLLDYPVFLEVIR